ncbi:MAG: glycosyltransferase family 39 protein [Candidatus Omnitrophica bacterium]|nr:glycosyltransferase family 39 protein [Candidatus Omnitrophota bacterium]
MDPITPAGPEPAWRRIPWSFLIPFALILGLAGWFRLWDLGGKSFWLDEFWTTLDSRKSLGYIYHRSLGNLHPFYTFMVKGASGVLGESDAVARLPAAIFSLLSIAATALLLRSLGYMVGGLCAAAFLATLPVHIEYARNARGYPVFLFFTIVSTWALIIAVRDNRRRWWLGYGTLGALTIYAHLLSGLCVVFCQAAAVLGTLAREPFARAADDARPTLWRGAFWGGLVGAALTGMLFFPWVTSDFGQYTESHTEMDFAAGASHVLHHLKAWIGGPHPAACLSLFFLAWGLGALALRLPFILMLFVAATPIAAWLAASVLAIVRQHESRYLLFLTFSTALVLGIGIETFARFLSSRIRFTSEQKRAAFGYAISLAVAALLASHSVGSARNALLFAGTEDWEGTANLIRTFNPDNSIVFMQSESAYEECLEYYGVSLERIRELSGDDLAGNLAAVEEQMAANKTIWIVSRIAFSIPRLGLDQLSARIVEVTLTPFAGIKVCCILPDMGDEHANLQQRVRLARAAKECETFWDPVKEIALGVAESGAGNATEATKVLTDARDRLGAIHAREIYPWERARMEYWLGQTSRWLFGLLRQDDNRSEIAWRRGLEWREWDPTSPYPSREMGFFAVELGKEESAAEFFRGAAERYRVRGVTAEAEYMRKKAEEAEARLRGRS